MQSVLSRNWTRIAVSISWDDNHYTTGTSFWWVALSSQICSTILSIIGWRLMPLGKALAQSKNKQTYPEFELASAELFSSTISIIPFRRCPWCNGYHHRIWTRRYEFKSWTWLIAFHIALIPLGKVWIQIFSLQLWVNIRAD